MLTNADAVIDIEVYGRLVRLLERAGDFGIDDRQARLGPYSWMVDQSPTATNRRLRAVEGLIDSLVRAALAAQTAYKRGEVAGRKWALNDALFKAKDSQWELGAVLDHLEQLAKQDPEEQPTSKP